MFAKTDAASRNVLEVTGDDIKHCARLYMRPLTPTQFYNEGYKPDAVRHKDYKGADCPVTVFFLFDAAKTLSYPGVCFLEKGGAGRQIKSRCSGEEQFAALNFQKIYHQNNYDPLCIYYHSHLNLHQKICKAIFLNYSLYNFYIQNILN